VGRGKCLRISRSASSQVPPTHLHLPVGVGGYCRRSSGNPAQSGPGRRGRSCGGEGVVGRGRWGEGGNLIIF
jgi:hypothetical protein